MTAILTAARGTDQHHPDEDTWVVPDQWWAKVAPFRGRGPVRPIRPGRRAGAWLRKMQEHNGFGDSLTLTVDGGQPELAAAARAAGVGEAQPDPLGAAAAGLLALGVGNGLRDDGVGRQLVDAWVELYGPARAAEIGALAAGLNLIWSTDTSVKFRVQPYAHRSPYGQPIRVVLARLRGWLAAAEEAEYAEAVQRLGRLRAEPGSLSIRMATSYLLPTEQDWLDADLRSASPDPAYGSDDANWLWHVCSATTAAQLAALPATQGWLTDNSGIIYSAAAHVGPAAADYLARVLRPYMSSDDRRMVLAVLGRLPCDRAFDLMLEHATEAGTRATVIDAALRFPRRALRMSVGRTGQEPMRDVVAAVYPEVAAEFGVTVPAPAGRTPVRGIATPAELPELLRTPPWERAGARPAPAVVPCTTTPRPTTMAWQPGEQQEWADSPIETIRRTGDWASELAAAVANPNSNRWHWYTPLLYAPVEAVVPHLDVITPQHVYDYGSGVFTRRVLGRFGDLLADRLLGAATQALAPTELLLPVAGTEVTALMIRWLDSKRHREVALAWFERHLGDGLPEVISAALGKPGRARTSASAVLRTLDERGHRDAIRTAAAQFGEQAAAAISAELDIDPLLLLPPALPIPPAWLAPAALAPIVLRDNGSALPAEAVATVCTMLALCSPNGDYAGIARLLAAAEPESLADFAWSAFQMWELAGYPVQQSWILHALGVVGTDDTARRLTPYIRAWPGESAHTRAVAGLDALVTIGSDLALMQLNAIAEKVKFAGLRTEARKRIDRIAEDRGISADELADLLVPDLGLAKDGTLHLDYGPRSFVVGFDEQLRPTVRDADGAPRKTLPKPGAKDDPELAPAAHRRLGALRKDVKTVAAEQIRRLERAMVQERRWTAARHRQVFVDHPLMCHLSRRLVWAAFDESGAVTGSFRIAEDRSLADATDGTSLLADDALIGIAHPLHLGDALGDWGEVFADYEILQPFPQLERRTCALRADERAHTLDRFHGRSVATAKLLGMTAHGWERGAPMDAGIIDEMYRDLGNGRTVLIDLNPGIIAGDALEWNEQTLTAIRIVSTGRGHSGHDRSGPTFAQLSPVTASELLRDLENLIG
ncbi:DUF4132 domain-containing protein [Nocardia sp. alder85J]|uniref:DUF4132 domain-containing protein n=1 Tax=Nocardia sp. alder85J TaxID=2862949 RepID=UPI001CD508A0|nr:DUF4132 domain-containing protein [Nocardia sp. alder85J]MCX4094883.1 DUF4132 domain-containing protein [Nocardia sp. alder85J]